MVSANWWLWHSYQSGKSSSTILNWSRRSPAHSLSWIVFRGTLRTPGWMVDSFLLQCGVSLSRMETEQLVTWRDGIGSSMQWSVDHIPTSTVGRSHQRRKSPNWSVQLDAGSQPPAKVGIDKVRSWPIGNWELTIDEVGRYLLLDHDL